MNLLGIDGGQTSTRSCLYLGQTGECYIEKCVPIDILLTEQGKQKGKTSIQNCMRSLLSQIPPGVAIDAAFISISGLYEEYKELLKSWILECIHVERFQIEGDARANLAGASAGRNDGVLIIAGGGSFGYYHTSVSEITSGGYGHILGDEGSSYWIGLQAMHAAIRSGDGRGEYTVLLSKVLDHYQSSSFWDIKKKIYSEHIKSKDIANLSLLVDRCADEGDQVAQNILLSAGNELGKLAISILRRANLHQPLVKRVYPTGGVFHSEHWVMDKFIACIHDFDPSIDVIKAVFPPVIGTIILAAESVNHKMDLSNLTINHAEEV